MLFLLLFLTYTVIATHRCVRIHSDWSVRGRLNGVRLPWLCGKMGDLVYVYISMYAFVCFCMPVCVCAEANQLTHVDRCQIISALVWELWGWGLWSKVTGNFLILLTYQVFCVASIFFHKYSGQRWESNIHHSFLSKNYRSAFFFSSKMRWVLLIFRATQSSETISAKWQPWIVATNMIIMFIYKEIPILTI